MIFDVNYFISINMLEFLIFLHYILLQSEVQNFLELVMARGRFLEHPKVKRKKKVERELDKFLV